MWCVVSLEGQYIIPPQQQIRRDNKWRRQMWKQLNLTWKTELNIGGSSSSQSHRWSRQSVSQSVSQDGGEFTWKSGIRPWLKLSSVPPKRILVVVGGSTWLLGRNGKSRPVRLNDLLLVCIYLSVFSFHFEPLRPKCYEMNIIFLRQPIEQKKNLLSFHCLLFVCQTLFF